MTIVLLTLSGILVIFLTCYASILILKLRKQTADKVTKQAELDIAQQAKLDEHLDSIRYIAAAMLDDRCELSEGVMRIAKLFGIISMSEQVAHDYPAIFKHFAVIESHPIMAKRKQLEKKARMKLDYARMCSEAELKTDILHEAKLLTSFTPPPLH
ncbi:DUF2489 domain-containing protein [Shewanella sp. VB17]|uniref:DUF2489 domain-containing protein n=1 Tax=Shewanella sp. VB17 TaxID=2739432 RepID=UPI001566B0CE|nr:DUF2489 domain-containing protein [Shewanella sp. VB17]NRD72039.1 DUF2489 domain-containing protein [Shewanella sp. VB17]